MSFRWLWTFIFMLSNVVYADENTCKPMERASALECAASGNYKFELYFVDFYTFTYLIRLFPDYQMSNINMNLTIGSVTLNSRHVFTRTFWGVHIDVIKPHCSVHVQYNTNRTETDLFYGVNLRDGYIFAKSPFMRNESSARFDVDSFDFPNVKLGGLQRSQVRIEMQWTSLNTPFRFEVIESALSKQEAKMFTYCPDTLH
ncbi:hypothetical protein M3Y94_00616400 [Aphelenchoides besseyi]|nr:hypothetical protein M3Y94_00616400 [Aphelenchoides besseyi]